MAVKTSPCPVETALNVISSRWVALILRDLFTGTKRFGELKRSLAGISQKVLTANLRALEEQGIVVRTVYPEVPPRVEYSLTELGQSLKPIIASLFDWGLAYKLQNGEETNDFIRALGDALH